MLDESRCLSRCLLIRRWTERGATRGLQNFGWSWGYGSNRLSSCMGVSEGRRNLFHSWHLLSFYACVLYCLQSECFRAHWLLKFLVKKLMTSCSIPWRERCVWSFYGGYLSPVCLLFFKNIEIHCSSKVPLIKVGREYQEWSEQTAFCLLRFVIEQ